MRSSASPASPDEIAVVPRTTTFTRAKTLPRSLGETMPCTSVVRGIVIAGMASAWMKDIPIRKGRLRHQRSGM